MPCTTPTTTPQKEKLPPIRPFDSNNNKSALSVKGRFPRLPTRQPCSTLRAGERPPRTREQRREVVQPTTSGPIKGRPFGTSQTAAAHDFIGRSIHPTCQNGRRGLVRGHIWPWSGLAVPTGGRSERRGGRSVVGHDLTGGHLNLLLSRTAGPKGQKLARLCLFFAPINSFFSCFGTKTRLLWFHRCDCEHMRAFNPSRQTRLSARMGLARFASPIIVALRGGERAKTFSWVPATVELSFVRGPVPPSSLSFGAVQPRRPLACTRAPVDSMPATPPATFCPLI